MKTRSRRGFSLLEMMVVLAIVLIMSGIAVPTLMRSLQRYQLESAVRNIANVLMRARYEAIRQNRLIGTIYVGPTGGLPARYGIDVNDNGALDAGEPYIFAARSMSLTTLSGSFGKPDYTDLAGPPSLRIGFSPEGKAYIRSGVTWALAPKIQAIFFVRGSGTTFIEQFMDPKRHAGSVTVTPAGRIRVWRVEGSGGWQTF